MTLLNKGLKASKLMLCQAGCRAVKLWFSHFVECKSRDCLGEQWKLDNQGSMCYDIVKRTCRSEDQNPISMILCHSSF
jgi:hypothetical protein